MVAGYIAYSQTSEGPFWAARADALAGQIVAALTSTKDQPLTPADCLISWGEPTQPPPEVEPMTWADFVNCFR